MATDDLTLFDLAEPAQARRALHADVACQHAFLPHQPSGTQTAAAAAWRPKTGTQRGRVDQAILDAGERGLTDEEIASELGLKENSVRPRCNELVMDELVRPLGRQRSASSGGPATVWVAVEQPGSPR